jgi:hypothetical protein
MAKMIHPRVRWAVDLNAYLWNVCMNIRSFLAPLFENTVYKKNVSYLCNLLDIRSSKGDNIMEIGEIKIISNKIKERGHNWTAGLTSMAALSPEEQRKRLGLAVTDEEKRALSDRIAEENRVAAQNGTVFVSPSQLGLEEYLPKQLDHFDKGSRGRWLMRGLCHGGGDRSELGDF